MEATQLAKEVLCSLITGDIEQHLSYLDEGFALSVRGMEGFGLSLRGLPAYREHLTEEDPSRYAAGFRLLGATPAVERGDGRVVQALLYLQDEITTPGGAVVPSDEPNTVHMVMEIEGDRVKSLTLRPARIYGNHDTLRKRG